MTYFGFLGIFLLTPIALLMGLGIFDQRRGRTLPPALAQFPLWAAILGHVIIALVYTTPWDNYLVATRVWWYDPTLVTGITLGWVPIEEYTFFVLQPIMSGLWLLYLGRRLTFPEKLSGEKISQLRWLLTITVGAVWLAAVVILIVLWKPGTYLALELGWALPPIMLQLAFGADILWRTRKLVFAGILVPTLYLSLADAIAIGVGVWTIDPAQSLAVFLGGILPVEEFIFFLLTNTLIIFGVTLILAQESQRRVEAIKEHFPIRQPQEKKL